MVNSNRVFRLTAIGSNAGSDVVEMKKTSLKSPNSILKVERENHYSVFITKGQELAFYNKKIRNIDGKDVPTMLLSNIWNDISYEGIAKEGSVTLKGGKKPERLIRRIIEMASNPNDLVLDFFAGSGTTASVALKLNRQFITVDQLDSQIDMSMKRLLSVVNGDSTGISKAVNWQGGGSFVYCELSKANQDFIDEIEEAKTKDELAGIWKRMQETGFLSYQIKAEDIDFDVDDFEELSIDDQKRLLMESLDKNLLYIPYSEIDNEEYNISDEDKRLTREFYKKG